MRAELSVELGGGTAAEADSEMVGVADSEINEFLENKTDSKLNQTTIGSKWSELQSSLWEQGDDAFSAPAIDMHFLAVPIAGKAVANVDFDALTGARQSVVSPGAMCFMPAGNACKLEMEGRYHVQHIMVARNVLEERMIAKVGDKADKVVVQGFCGHHDKMLFKIAMEILKESITSDGENALKSDDLAIKLADRLIACTTSAMTLLEAGPSLSPVQTTHAIEYMEGNLAKNFGHADIAAYVGMPTAQFAKAFEQETGQSLDEYRLERRVDTVREWLLGSGRNATALELARAIGFNTVEQLDAAFRANLGTSFENYRSGRLG
ncbi:MAG: AraC family transcriptional regulator [Pseudomonadota bacterium]